MLLRTHIRHPLTDLTLFATIDKQSKPVLKGILFGIHKKWRGRASRLVEGPFPQLRGLRRSLSGFLDGKAKSLRDVPLDVTGFTNFQKRVLQTARSIQWGNVVSYSDLARMSGRPAAVRAVASVMRNNDFPLVVPCHRIVRKDGSIGGFMGKTKGKCVELKKRLLERETSTRLPSTSLRNHGTLLLTKEKGRG
ncbi:MAG: methylated-DNA--[protein]-cysteine S-methyltransferase [Chitinivibrionales bacterium]